MRELAIIHTPSACVRVSTHHHLLSTRALQELKEELAVLRGEKIYRSGALSGDEKERCMQLVQSFLATGNTATKRDGEEDETGGLPVGDPKKLAEVFRIFRGMILAGGGGGGASSGGATAAGASGGSGVDSRFALPPPDFTKSPEYQRMQQMISTQKQQVSGMWVVWS